MIQIVVFVCFIMISNTFTQQKQGNKQLLFNFKTNYSQAHDKAHDNIT